MKSSLVSIIYLCDALAGLVRGLAADSPDVAKTGIDRVAQQIDNDAKLLGKAWSDMALRNLLSDLLRGVRRVQAVQTTFDRSPMMRAHAPANGGGRARRVAADLDERPDAVRELCADLVRRLDLELAQHSPSKGRYSEVVCIGYRVKVAGDAYLGRTDDASDMRGRCDDLKKAIRAAYALADRDGRNYNARGKLLKVFVAPEFFFRGANGAYDHAVVHGNAARTDDQGRLVDPANKGLVEIMLEELNQPCYKDWLFVLGTAIAATEEKAHRCMAQGCGGKVVFDVDAKTGRSSARCDASRNHRVIERSLGAFVENVGFIVKEGEVHTVSKELVSHIDYVKDKAKGERDLVTVGGSGKPVELKVRRHVQASGYTSASNTPSRFSDERMGGCIFTIDGVTIGVEVCLDHASTTGNATSGRLEHAANIQLQLIPSAGMSIKVLRTLPDGIAFNVDGLTPHVHVAGGKRNDVQINQDGGSWVFGGLSAKDFANSGSSTDKLLDLKSKGKATLANAAPPQAAGGRGSVVLFGPYDIPRA